MGRPSRTGKCHICGKISKLSYEHIPPASAFNDTSAKVYSALDIIQGGGLPWETDGVPGKILQRGVGDYTLCVPCNSFTGAKYAKDFISACRQAMGSERVQLRSDIGRARVGVLNINPLNFGKQVLAMFASVNNENFFDGQPRLRELVLDEKAHGISSEEYGLFMYLYMGGMGRNAGVSARMSMSGNSTISTELSAMPFGFVLVLKPDRDNLPECGTEITRILDYEPGTVGDFLFELPMFVQNSPMPLDFRTKEDILQQAGRDEEVA